MHSRDWICPRCSTSNYADRIKCRGPVFTSCGYIKNHSVQRPIPTMKPGDWICISCHRLNFRSRSTCFRCSTPKEVRDREDSALFGHPPYLQADSHPQSLRAVGPPDVKDVATEDEKEACKVCYENKRVISFQPCGHTPCCYGCSKQVNVCPVCRGNIENRVKVYL